MKINYSKNIIIEKELLPTFTKADLLIYNPIIKKILGDMVYELNSQIPHPNPLLFKEREKLLTSEASHTNSGEVKKAAFTLAETLIALTVLGIIAAITIPPLVKRNQQAQNRIRIKKGMSIYDMLISKMLIENNIKSLNELKTWANKPNCPDSSKYFKIVEVLNNNGCTFKTADGIFWDISDITHPIVATKAANLNDPDNSLTFTFQVDEDEGGAFRINDLSFAQKVGEDYIELEKLYAFIQGKEYDAVAKKAEIKNQNNVDFGNPKLNDIFNNTTNICSTIAGGTYGAGSNCYTAYSWKVGGLNNLTNQEALDNHLSQVNDCTYCSAKYIYDENGNGYTFYCDVQNHQMTNCEFSDIHTSSNHYRGYNSETGKFDDGTSLADALGSN